MTLARSIPALILAALAAAPAASAPATTTDDEADGGFAIGPSAQLLFASLQGHAYADRDLSSGTSLALRDDLDLSRTSTLVELGVVAAWWDAWSPGQRFLYGFEVRGMWGDWTGRPILNASASFDGATYPSGDYVRSTFSVDLTQIHATAAWEITSESLTAQVGGFFGIAILGASTGLEGTWGPDERVGLRQAAIGGGIRASVSPCPWFDAGLEAAYHGMSLHVDGEDWAEYEEDTELVDLSARISVRPWKYAAVEVGYRFLDAYLFRRDVNKNFGYTGERTETEISWRIQGLFIGGTIRF